MAKSFSLFEGDTAIQVRIDDDGFTTVSVENIQDVAIVIEAINRASRAGAVRGTMFTGDVVHDEITGMSLMRAETGTTWLGGEVTRLSDGKLGPRFRVDWDVFPFVTE